MLGLRGRTVLLLALLLAVVSVGLTWVAGGLLHQTAQEAVHLGGEPARLGETVAAAQTVLWLAASALLAVAVGIAAASLRGPIFGPLERLGRRLEREHVVPGLPQGTPLVARIGRTLAHQRQLLERHERENAGHLDVVQAYGAAMDHARSQLVAADRLAMTGQLALGAGHELGGSLALAVACLDTLGILSPAELGDGETLNARLTQASDALQRVDAIASELGSFGLPFDGAGPPADPAATARAVATLSRLHARCRRIELVVSVHPEVEGRSVTMGQRHLEQVLLNLLVNAADATEGRGQVEISVRASDGGIQIAVQDDGPGVDPALRDRVFEPFFSTKAPGAGSGLGLAVSRRLVQEAGGRLQLAASASGGARFDLLLRVHGPGS